MTESMYERLEKNGPHLVFIRRGDVIHRIRGNEAQRLNIPLAAIFVRDDGKLVGCTHRTIGTVEKKVDGKWSWVLIPRNEERPGRFNKSEWDTFRGKDKYTDGKGDDVTEWI